MTGSLDWLFWTIGWVLAAVGGSLLAVALFWDRARGRRRCPRCWYNMAGVPGLTCPECGRVVRKERSLRRTRRRRRLAAVAVCIGIVGVGALKTPAVIHGGWVRVVPTTALVFALPWGEVDPLGAYRARVASNPTLRLGLPAMPARSWRMEMYHELLRRLGEGRLWGWQTGIVVNRAIRGDSTRPPHQPAWNDAYGSILEMLWNATLAEPTAGTSHGSTIAMNASGLRTLRRERVCREIAVDQLMPTESVVRSTGFIGAGSFQVSAVDQSGRPTGWVQLITEAKWPWSDGYAGPLPIVRSGPLPLLVRYTSEGREVWRVPLEMPVAGSSRPGLGALPSDAIASALRDSLDPGMAMRRVYGMTPLLWMRIRHPAIASATPEDVTLGVGLEVVHDGQVFARGGVWWRATGPEAVPELNGWPGGALVRLTPAVPDVDVSKVPLEGTWVLRVNGVETWARRDRKAVRYWQGAVEMPMRVTDEGTPWPPIP